MLNESANSNNFTYENVEVTKVGGKKFVRKVSIKNGKGTKSVTKYHKGRHLGSVKKQIHKDHIEMISLGKFVKGLFSDCKCGATEKNKTRKNRTKRNK
jgi:hypothetical protein